MRLPPLMTAAATGMLILVRHGESEWNSQNRFTGWMDVPLTQSGRKDARNAASLLSAAEIRIDQIYTSSLSRAVETADM